MKIAYCIKCGNKFPVEAVFCPYCGTKLYRNEEDSKTNQEIGDLSGDKGDSVVLTNNPVEIVSINPSKPETGNNSQLPTEIIYSRPVIINPNRFDSQKQSAHGASEDDELEEPNLAMCVLSFLFPIVGFISAMINSGSNKKKSKAYAKWAGIGFLFNFVLSILQSL